MATKTKPKIKGKLDCILRGRVEEELKTRVIDYGNRPDVRRKESFIVREAVAYFLEHHEKNFASNAGKTP